MDILSQVIEGLIHGMAYFHEEHFFAKKGFAKAQKDRLVPDVVKRGKTWEGAISIHLSIPLVFRKWFIAQRD